jgi:hypothetical protein
VASFQKRKNVNDMAVGSACLRVSFVLVFALLTRGERVEARPSLTLMPLSVERGQDAQAKEQFKGMLSRVDVGRASLPTLVNFPSIRLGCRYRRAFEYLDDCRTSTIGSGLEIAALAILRE